MASPHSLQLSAMAPPTPVALDRLDGGKDDAEAEADRLLAEDDLETGRRSMADGEFKTDLDDLEASEGVPTHTVAAVRVLIHSSLWGERSAREGRGRRG